MVEAQLVNRGITDERVIGAFLKVPRHLFVDEHLTKQAYDDNPLPIAGNQTISQPYMVALMLEHLHLQSNHKVLEIGTGSGYQTALLTELCREVYTIDRLAELTAIARKRLGKLGYHSINYKTGDGTLGWPENAPYERIIISAGSPRVPDKLIEQLSNDNGILLCPVGNEFSQDLIQVIKRNGRIEKNNLGSCVFVKLVGEEGWKE
ncbi:MAG: protein-L-isoaspartate(D-aspartate) O-methyltransferase [Planctomycetota bacterium]